MCAAGRWAGFHLDTGVARTLQVLLACDEAREGSRLVFDCPECATRSALSRLWPWA